MFLAILCLFDSSLPQMKSFNTVVLCHVSGQIEYIHLFFVTKNATWQYYAMSLSIVYFKGGNYVLTIQCYMCYEVKVTMNSCP